MLDIIMQKKLKRTSQSPKRRQTAIEIIQQAVQTKAPRPQQQFTFKTQFKPDSLEQKCHKLILKSQSIITQHKSKFSNTLGASGFNIKKLPKHLKEVLENGKKGLEAYEQVLINLNTILYENANQNFVQQTDCEQKLKLCTELLNSSESRIQ